MPFVRKPADTTELAHLAAIAAAAERAVTDEIARPRHEGASWLDIAEAIGTPRQNAWRKYKDWEWNQATGHAEQSGDQGATGTFN